jgi:hypothetical protein
LATENSELKRRSRRKSEHVKRLVMDDSGMSRGMQMNTTELESHAWRRRKTEEQSTTGNNCARNLPPMRKSCENEGNQRDMISQMLEKSLQRAARGRIGRCVVERRWRVKRMPPSEIGNSITESFVSREKNLRR